MALQHLVCHISDHIGWKLILFNSSKQKIATSSWPFLPKNLESGQLPVNENFPNMFLRNLWGKNGIFEEELGDDWQVGVGWLLPDRLRSNSKCCPIGILLASFCWSVIIGSQRPVLPALCRSEAITQSWNNSGAWFGRGLWQETKILGGWKQICDFNSWLGALLTSQD